MILAPTNRRVIRPYDKPSFEHTQRYGLIKGHWANRNRVGLWLFNEGSSRQVLDLSGYNGVGTLINNTFWASGKSGPALNFPGSDDYVGIGNKSYLNFGTSDFSIVAGIRTSAAERESFVSKWTGETDGYLLDLLANGKVRFLIQAGVGDYWYRDTSIIVNDNIFHQIAGVRKGSTIDAYVDGIISLVSPVGSQQDASSEGSFTIAQRAGWTGSNDFIGLIDYINVYNCALFASEIALLCGDPFLGIQREPRITYFFVPTGGEDIQKTINDSVGLTDVDSLIKEIYRTFDESIGVTDVDSKVWNSIRIVAESLGITDVLSKEEAKTISESLGITDAVSRVSVVLRTLVESLGITDSVSEVWAAVRTLSESLGITDATDVTLENLQIIDDDIGLTDTTSKIHIALRTLSENLGLTDDISRVFIISRIISDAEGLTDGLALQRIMTVADTLGITDDVTRLIDYLRMEDDDLGLLDSMVRVSLALRTIDDDMGITDEMSAQIEALLKAVWAFVVMRQTHS